MVEILLIGFGVWAIVLTWGVGNLYTRPKDGLSADDVDAIKDFMADVRRMAATESRKGRKPRG